MKSVHAPSLRSHILVAAWLCLAPTALLRAQHAAPADRNATNTAVRPGGMMADSPVTFPPQGALPSRYPPDVKEWSEPAEEGYYLFSSPCRSLEQIRAIQQEMPRGEFTAPPADWTHPHDVAKLLRLSTVSGNRGTSVRLGLGGARVAG